MRHADQRQVPSLLHQEAEWPGAGLGPSSRVLQSAVWPRDAAWAKKCFEASCSGALVVLLAHARTDTRWFHDWVYGKAAEIRFVRGRLRFGDGTQSAPFPSLVAVYRPTAIQKTASK